MATTTLFRTVSPDARTLPGSAGLRSPGWGVLTLFLTAAAAALAGFAAVASYARKQPAVGLVVPRAGVVRVSAPQPGTIAALFVADGSVVEAGTPLFAIDYRRALPDGGTLDASLRRALDGQEALLNEQIAGEAIRAAHESAGLDGRVAGLEADRRALLEHRGLLERRVRVAAERFDGVGDLRRRGLITETDFRAREDAWLARRQELAEMDQRGAALDQARQQAVLLQAQAPADSADRIAKLRGAVADVQRHKAEAAAASGAVVRAPVAGRVTAVQAAAGQQAGPGKPLLALVPQAAADAAMRAELFVPSRAIGFVRPGQVVRLMYDAFPFQRFGAFTGTIEGVSETMLTPDEVAGPVRPDGPAYRVSVRLDHDRVATPARDVPLQPDMTLRADIVLERRTVLHWLLDPVLAAGRGVRS